MKTISIGELEQSDVGGVYCLNCTPSEMRSQVVFTVQKLNGNGLDNVFIPATAKPIELTTQVSRKQLINSSEFRRAVAFKQIQLITQAYYDELMGEEGSLEEVARAMGEMTANLGQTVTEGKEDAQAATVTSTAIHPQVMLQVEQLRNNECGELDALTKMRNLGQLNEQSYKFISKNTKEFPLVQSWIKRVREEQFGG